jgi:hypothetical protein
MAFAVDSKLSHIGKNAGVVATPGAAKPIDLDSFFDEALKRSMTAEHRWADTLI